MDFKLKLLPYAGSDLNVIAIAQIHLLLRSSRLVGFLFAAERLKCELGMFVTGKIHMDFARRTAKFNLSDFLGLDKGMGQKHLRNVIWFAESWDTMNQEMVR